MADQQPSRSLRQSAGSGFMWTAGQTVVSRLLTALVFFYLSHVLAPREFGLVAVALVFITGMQVLAAAGLSPALVQREKIDDLDRSSSFWLAVGVATVLAVGLVIASKPIADAYDLPRLTAVLRALAACPLLLAAGAVPMAVLQRRLDFKGLALRAIVGNVGGAVIGLVFAMAGAGVWTLVAQSLSTVALSTAMVWVMSRWRPTLQFSLRRIRELMGFSVGVLGNDLLVFVNQRTDDFLVGLYLGAAALGVYSVSYRLLQLILDVVVVTGQTVGFPVLARLNSDPPRLRTAFGTMLRLYVVAALPIFLLVSVNAPDLVAVLLGHQWHQAGPVVRVFALFGCANVVSYSDMTLMMSIGRSRTVLGVQLVNSVLVVAGFVVAAHYGVVWVAAALVVAAYLVAPMLQVSLGRMLDIGIGWHLRVLRGPVLGVAGLLALDIPLRALLPASISPWWRLACCVPAGLLGFLAVTFLVDRTALTEALTTLRSLRRSDAPAAMVQPFGDEAPAEIA